MTGQVIVTIILVGVVVAGFIYINVIFPKKNKEDSKDAK